MKWGDIFQDPDMVGSSEYRAVYDLIATAVMGADEPDPEAKISTPKQERIQGILEVLMDEAQAVYHALQLKGGSKYVTTHRIECACGHVIRAVERKNKNASGGRAIELEHRKGAFTAKICLESVLCPECEQQVAAGFHEPGNLEVTVPMTTPARPDPTARSIRFW